MPVRIAADRRSPAAPSPVSTPFGAKVLRQRSEGGRLCRIRPVSPNCPELCRFSDAGNGEARHTLGRPASEKRRGTKSREVGAPPVPRALWGFSRGVRLGEVGQSARPIALPGRMGVGDGPNERSGRCRTGLAVSLRADLSTCGKRRVCWPSQPEWRASLGWWIGGEGIMRCRC